MFHVKGYQICDNSIRVMSGENEVLRDEVEIFTPGPL
jgi:hypothetical protein